MAVDKQFTCILLLLALDWRQLAVSAAAEFSRLHTRSIRRVLPPSQQDTYDGDACLHSFQVTENTIIRTQDSRNLGAKYLNETELPTKAACLQWCCDTSECNVAVYEEKNKGSCYIFDCNPAAEFKCKFTSHNHYSIAVLRIARHSYDLGKWGSESKHEEELKYLRMTSLANTIPTSPLTTASTTTTSTTVATEAPMAPVVGTVPSTSAKGLVANVQPTSEKEHRCSRFQFECRNTSECIAIYNACDGIPQCSDGSDESEELECPPTGNVRKPKPAAIGGSTSHSGKHAENVVPNEDHSDIGGPFVNNQPVLEPDRQPDPPASLPYLGQPRSEFVHQQLQEQHQQGQLQQQPNQYYKAKAARPDSHPAGSIFNHKGNGLLQNQPYEPQNNVPYHRPASPHAAYSDQYEPPSQDDESGTSYTHSQQQHPLAAPHNYPNPDYEGGSDYWQPETARQKQPESFSSYDHPRMPGNPHKSAHEGSMSQSYSHGQPQNHIPSNHGHSQSLPPEHYDNRNTFSPRIGYNYHENYQMDPLNVPQGKDSYSEDLGQSTGNGQAIAGIPPYRMEPKAAKKTVPAEAPISFDESKAGMPSEVKPHSSSTELKDQQMASHVLPNEIGIDGALPFASETTIKPDVIPTEVPITPTVKMTEASIHSHAQLHKVEVNLAQVAVQDIDESNESSGAVLALTLGLSITGLLLVLVGCRLRVVRRHLRRGRSPYAHDADYLVNGMYL